MKPVSISVGQLTDFCRRGDINFRFSAKSSAIEGIRGHQRVQKSRGESYLAEHPVSIELKTEGIDLEVGGRIDGCWYEKTRGLFCIEEIKTLRVEVEDIPQGVLDSYWHQAQLYGYIAGSQAGVDRLVLRLCFYHLDRKSEAILERVVDIQELAEIFVDTLGFFSTILAQRQKWITARNVSMRDLAFPYGEFRSGQRDMAVSVYRAVADDRQLIIEAPTGIGKTMATLYPAIKAMESSAANRLFYLSAKTSTQVLAQIALKDLTLAGGSLRSIVITSKEKICFSPGQPCHPDHCEYAKGYYDQVHETIDTLLGEAAHFDRANIESAARRDGVCPFELGLDLSRSCDAIIADYNYVFDPVVYLRRYFDTNNRDSIALVDEAHNLVDRGRDMFSAEVYKESYLAIAKTLKSTAPAVMKAAQKVNRALLGYKKQYRDEFEEHGYITGYEIPESVVSAMQTFCSSAEEELRKETYGSFRDDLLSCYFDTLRFLRTAENFNVDYAVLFQREPKRHSLKLYCIDPSRQLGEGFDRLASTICFSATMQPAEYFRRMLGASEAASWYRIPSPFRAANLQVNVAGYIDTSYKGRNQSLSELIDLVRCVTTARRGNYLVFFPSYDYLRSAVQLLEERFPGICTLVQQRQMSDEERQNFLGAFKEGGEVCGFAVMGGAFSEGVDLKGNRLIGAIVVGVGLPQIGIERDLIRDHFPGAGFEYAYQYPGLVRVLQTAGRVIRDEKDRGIICLVDGRYRERRYLDLLPPEWVPGVCENPAEIAANLESFWNRQREPAGL
jgi:DNA excision repair protein ERCC-2